jgi:hypothetical protein
MTRQPGSVRPSASLNLPQPYYELVQAFAERVLPRAADLWVEASLESAASTYVTDLPSRAAMGTRPLSDPLWDHVSGCTPCRIDVREIGRGRAVTHASTVARKM